MGRSVRTVGFIPGIVGRLYQQFAITIAISVVISAFIALSLTPALCTLLLKPTRINQDAKGLNKLFFQFNNWFQRVTDRYSEGVKKEHQSIPFYRGPFSVHLCCGLLFVPV
ncbi:efflux RND transporter permease subunit [Mucilaginibacter sp. UC70_90]